MNQQQVSAIREQINAAHQAGDLKLADSLQSKLNDHFTAQADSFMRSAEGSRWMDRLMERA